MIPRKPDANAAGVLVTVVTEFAVRKLPALNDRYHWRIGEPLPPGIVLPVGTLYEQNISLKEQLHAKWNADPDVRLALATYYVATWGGVKRNNAETLRGYVDHVDQDPTGLAKSIKGVASWSKVLCIREPKKYAIFDARVSTALNCLQIVKRVKRGIEFPRLPSRNSLINTAAPRIDEYAKAHDWAAWASEDFYAQYLVILARTARRLKQEVWSIEMLLFCEAECLVEQALAVLDALTDSSPLGRGVVPQPDMRATRRR